MADPLFIGEVGNTPLGSLWLAVSKHGLVAVEWSPNRRAFTKFVEKRYGRPVELAPEKIKAFAVQLREYLNGQRSRFTFPIDWSVLSDFQRAALRATFAIPYGQTRTYKQLAEQLGNPRAARAVGRAEATNPMPLVIPCHRLVGSDGELHGYGGGDGLPTKEWLLRLEGARH